DTTGTFSKHSSTLSNGGVAAMVGGAGGLYLLGSLRSDEHQKETGILAGEAAINSVVVVEAIRALTRRARPNEGSGLGEFGKGSALHSGFPSIHAPLPSSPPPVLTPQHPALPT